MTMEEIKIVELLQELKANDEQMMNTLQEIRMKTMLLPEKYISLKQASILLNLSYGQTRRLCESGKLKHKQNGVRFLILESDIAKFQNQ